MKKLTSLLVFLVISVFVRTSLMAEIPLETQNQLVGKAVEAQQRAYAPYSKYKVGAALLTADGQIIQGCNVENASYGLCNCAERTAIFKAVSEGKKEFAAIAVVTRDGGSPCGACRQVLNEFNPEMTVIIANQKSEILKTLTVEQLLPEAFGPKNLN